MARPRTDISARILAAARARFRKSGVDAASLRSIARDAGTSIGMIYYYYPTKDDLFFAAVEEVYQKFLADLEQALRPEGGVEERLVRLFERLGAMSEREVEMIKLVVHEALISSPRFERVTERALRGHFPLVLRTLYLGLRGRFAKHRPIARWTLPIWLYVSVTGVIVYLMLHHLR